VLIGYLQVSPSDDADRAALRRALDEAGCEQVVEEELDVDDSGQQLELHGLFSRLRIGDAVVVAQLDSLGRSLPDVVRWAGPFSSNLTTQGIGPDQQQDASHSQRQLRHAMPICDQKIRTEWPWCGGCSASLLPG